ncbi:MAG: NAD(P)/FAD-dependent oxidoreductase [Paracoccaceae bacterium]|nr:NAD(P)/FAD-dependent oxidoreductase [Paracoccaceae bacterium]
MSINQNSLLTYDAVIIGAGFSGLQQLHFLRDRLGLKTLVLEAGESVGGTWYWNRYPGARCDSESHTYCFYFSEKILKDWNWSERYPGQKEILNYLNFVTDTLNLRASIQFNTRVTRIQYDQSKNFWILKSRNGAEFRAKYVISAVGCLSSTNCPEMTGTKDFIGELYHTGEWPHETVNFVGKKIGIIGTGSSGIQAIPIIANSAKELIVFQRTPNFSVPARNAKLSDEFISKFKSNIPYYKKQMLAARHGHPWRAPDRSVRSTPRNERDIILEKAWNIGGLRFRESFGDTLTDLESNELMSAFIKQKILDLVKDSRKAEILTKFDHPFGTKRPALDTNYFETFNRDNVKLFDIREDPIKCLTRNGLETNLEKFNFDMIIFATGFDALTGSLMKMEIIGRDGIRLSDEWKNGPKTYLGLQVSGFPNFFIVTGPGSPSVLTNMPQSIDQNVTWITDCISHLIENEFTKIEAEEHAMNAWMKHVQEEVEGTLFLIAKHSWYLGSNIEGKPQVFMPYVGGLDKYREICKEVAKDDYRGFQLS